MTAAGTAAVRGRLTVISSVKNAAANLGRTIASVAGQTWRNTEYIIVDGGSTDGTAGIAARHEEAVSRFVSEKDEGVYFGMNRGVDLATGEWACFLNAGDIFCGPDVTARAMKSASPDLDIIYGDHFFGDEAEARRALPFEQLWDMLQNGALDEAWILGFPCHQAVLARTDLLRELRYDTHFRHAAEQDFLFRAFARGKRFGKADVAVTRYEPGGLSHRFQVRSLLEKRAILRKYHRSAALEIFFAKRLGAVIKRRVKERVFPA